jgi:hypothetical protein
MNGGSRGIAAVRVLSGVMHTSFARLGTISADALAATARYVLKDIHDEEDDAELGIVFVKIAQRTE